MPRKQTDLGFATADVFLHYASMISPQQTATMRAQVLHAHGGPENFVLSDIPAPQPGMGQVLVRIAAASINQLDIKIREGLPAGPMLPAVLGADMAGTVAAVGSTVAGFKPGDRVYGLVGGVRGYGGTLAEYVVADARLLAPAPRALPLREAAALPLVAITARDALARLGLASADHVLIHGGAGGVGHIAVQLAKARGARVAATTESEAAMALARQLGADEAIDFRSESVESYVTRLTNGRGFDAIFDTVGGGNLDRSFAAAAAGGRLVTTNARIALDLSPMHAKALSLAVVFVMLPLLERENLEAHGQALREIAALVDAGRLRPLLDPARFTLETIPEAHRYLASGKAQGKIVVDIAAES